LPVVESESRAALAELAVDLNALGDWNSANRNDLPIVEAYEFIKERNVHTGGFYTPRPKPLMVAFATEAATTQTPPAAQPAPAPTGKTEPVSSPQRALANFQQYTEVYFAPGERRNWVRAAVWGPWAIHQYPGGYGNVLTHIPTGLPVAYSLFDSHLAEFALALNALGDWSSSNPADLPLAQARELLRQWGGDPTGWIKQRPEPSTTEAEPQQAEPAGPEPAGAAEAPEPPSAPQQPEATPAGTPPESTAPAGPQAAPQETGDPLANFRRRATVKVQTDEGWKEVNAAVWGPWAIHRHPEGGYALTHIPTGLLAAQSESRAVLAEFARELNAIGDWSSANRSDLPLAQARDLLRQWQREGYPSGWIERRSQPLSRLQPRHKVSREVEAQRELLVQWRRSAVEEREQELKAIQDQIQGQQLKESLRTIADWLERLRWSVSILAGRSRIIPDKLLLALEDTLYSLPVEALADPTEIALHWLATVIRRMKNPAQLPSDWSLLRREVHEKWLDIVGAETQSRVNIRVAEHVREALLHKDREADLILSELMFPSVRRVNVLYEYMEAYRELVPDANVAEALQRAFAEMPVEAFAEMREMASQFMSLAKQYGGEQALEAAYDRLLRAFGRLEEKEEIKKAYSQLADLSSTRLRQEQPKTPESTEPPKAPPRSEVAAETLAAGEAVTPTGAEAAAAPSPEAAPETAPASGLQPRHKAPEVAVQQRELLAQWRSSLLGNRLRELQEIHNRIRGRQLKENLRTIADWLQFLNRGVEDGHKAFKELHPALVETLGSLPIEALADPTEVALHWLATVIRRGNVRDALRQDVRDWWSTIVGDENESRVRLRAIEHMREALLRNDQEARSILDQALHWSTRHVQTLYEAIERYIRESAPGDEVATALRRAFAELPAEAFTEPQKIVSKFMPLVKEYGGEQGLEAAHDLLRRTFQQRADLQHINEVYSQLAGLRLKKERRQQTEQELQAPSEPKPEGSEVSAKSLGCPKYPTMAQCCRLNYN
jgi:hypothetical protein